MTGADEKPLGPRARSAAASFPRLVLATALETFFQTRGLALWIVCALGVAS